MPSKKELDSVTIPQFPPLALCLLVDASHRSKNEILKNIVATDVFENIEIAKSMPDGVKSISGRGFDACIIGPSIRSEVAQAYIDEIRSASFSEDCAIIVLAKEGVDVDLFSGADSVCTVPTSKLNYFESIVRGIIIANRGSVLPGIRLNDDGRIEIMRNGDWKILNSLSENVYKGLHPDFVLEETEESIERFCSSMQQTPRSKLEKILVSILSKDHTTDPFLAYFKQAIVEWKEELEFSTLKEASLNLRWKLLDYCRK